MANMAYHADDLPRLFAQGDWALKNGPHALWLWAKADAELTVTVDGQAFDCPPAGADREAGLWRRLGEVTLRKDKRFRVAITARRPYLDSKADLVAQLVLASDTAFDPARTQALSRVLGSRLDRVRDPRLTLARGTDTHFHFPRYTSLREWEARAAYLRDHIRVTTGLWPDVERYPLTPRIFGRTEREDYTVEKVCFESYPGFLVTGNLYRPKHVAEPVPGIANPHGHWGEGRLADNDQGSVPGRCINFAKMGCVAFSYDMVGKRDSLQVPHDFHSDVAELWGVNMMGLQLYNSIRAVDFLQSLPDVDPNAIGCTGTSGGGTQTFMLMAIDERVKAAAPVCMVSGIMQGGCICENAPSLRLDTYNAEIAALMAPRPLLLVAATGDWTRLNPEEEYPGIRSVYKLYGAQDRVKCVRFDAPHNYNRDSREAVYRWFAKWLMDRPGAARVREVPFAPEKDEDLLLYPTGRLPEGAPTANAVLSTAVAAAKHTLATPALATRAALRESRQTAKVGLEHAISASVSKPADLAVERGKPTRLDGFSARGLVLGRKSVGDQIPAVLFAPERARPGRAVLVVHPQGKAALADPASGTPGKLVARLLQARCTVLAMDAFLTGEHHSPFEPTEWDTSERHFWTFHRKAAAEQVQDILTAAACLRRQCKTRAVGLMGIGEAGLWCLFAAALDPNINAAAADADRMDPDDDAQWTKRFPVPAIRRVGDLAAAAALLAPRRLLIHNAGERFSPAPFETAFAAAGARRRLSLWRSPASEGRLVRWLMA